MGTVNKTFMNLEAIAIIGVDLKRLFANSACLFLVVSAENRAELEGRIALGRNITYVKGKLAMMVMSKHSLDASNMTKIAFPVMLLEPDRLYPRDGILQSLSLNVKRTNGNMD